MRFSLRWLLATVAFVAVSLVALLNATNEWRSAFENASLFALLVATAAAVYSAGERRAFCVGFVLFGLTYFVILAIGYFNNTRERLITTTGLRSVHKQIFPAKSDVVPFQEPFDGDVLGSATSLNDGTNNVRVMIVRPKCTDFIGVGNAALCIPFGLLGGFIARGFYRRRVANLTGS
jgi:lysylphosphatidylglycerol synthetase-like protein (DUF2156 family)